MSINRNRSAGQKFIAETKQLGSSAVARVEAYKVYNSYGSCTRCFPHGPETVNNKWRNAKGKKWNKRRHGIPLRDLIENGSSLFSFIFDTDNIRSEKNEDDRWLELNQEYDNEMLRHDVFNWGDGGNKSSLPAGWTIDDLVEKNDLDLHDYHYESDMEEEDSVDDIDLTEDDYNWLLEIEERSRETIQPDAVYHDHYLDEEDYDGWNYNEDYDDAYMDNEVEPSRVVRLRGGIYIEI